MEIEKILENKTIKLILKCIAFYLLAPIIFGIIIITLFIIGFTTGFFNA